MQEQTQYTDSDTLYWSKERKLTWDDFHGVPDTTTIGMAGTSSGFWFRSFYTTDTTLEFVVSTIFFKKHSWVKTNWDKTAYALNHEQRHFDITEVYARKLRQAFKSYKLNKATVIKDCDKFYNSLRIERDKMQAVYDMETKHSLNISKQKEWDAKIDKWLQEYEH